MFAITGKKVAALVAALCAFACIGCFSSPMEPDTDPAQVVIETRLPGSPAAPARLLLTLTSNRRDTLQDTITPQGSRLSRRFAYLDARAGRSQSVTGEYALAPGRRWSVSVRLLDARDSVQMADSVSFGALKAFERREARLTPAQRFATCPARFVLPAAHGALGLEFTRLQLLIDGKVARDTVAPGGRPFAPGEAHAVSLVGEYVAQGTRQVAFRAYGRAQGADAQPRLLFEGGRAVEAVAGQAASTQDIDLAWQPRELAGEAGEAGAVGDSGEQGAADDVGLKVTVGKVGTVKIVAQMSGAIDL